MHAQRTWVLKGYNDSQIQLGEGLSVNGTVELGSNLVIGGKTVFDNLGNLAETSMISFPAQRLSGFIPANLFSAESVPYSAVQGLRSYVNTTASNQVDNVFKSALTYYERSSNQVGVLFRDTELNAVRQTQAFYTSASNQVETLVKGIVSSSIYQTESLYICASNQVNTLIKGYTSETNSQTALLYMSASNQVDALIKGYNSETNSQTALLYMSASNQVDALVKGVAVDSVRQRDYLYEASSNQADALVRKIEADSIKQIYESASNQVKDLYEHTYDQTRILYNSTSNQVDALYHTAYAANEVAGAFYVSTSAHIETLDTLLQNVSSNTVNLEQLVYTTSNQVNQIFNNSNATNVIKHIAFDEATNVMGVKCGLDVRGDIFQNGALVNFGNGSNGVMWSVNGSSDLFTTRSKVGIGFSNPTHTLQVMGDVYATGDIIALSDERAKTDLCRMTGALDKIKQLNGYTFLKRDASDGRRHLGVVAQEVVRVVPEAVHVDEESGLMAVAYPNLIAVLIEGIKELDAKLDALMRPLRQDDSIVDAEHGL